MLKVNVYRNGNWETITSETEFSVARVGSGQSLFGENAKLIKVLKNNLVFETESGTLVKTEIDTLNTVGKAKKSNYFILKSKFDLSKKDNIYARTAYWNDKKAAFEYK